MSKISPSDLIHHPYRPPTGFESIQPPSYRASTVLFPDTRALHSWRWEDKSAYTYGLHGTPGSFLLEERIATLEGGRYCVLAPSGMAALTLSCLAVLEQGDEVLIPDNVYGSSRAMCEHLLARWGIACITYRATDVQHLQDCISDRSRLVWLEAPGSVTMEFPDLLEQVRICKTRGVLTALDTTWSGGIAYDSFDLAGSGLAVDLAAHALTKYPSGGGDVLMGAVVTDDLDLHRKLQFAQMHLGYNVVAEEIERVVRGLPSLVLRYAAHDRSARALARWAASQPQFVQVLHPALPGAPGHEHWLQLCGSHDAAAGIFSVIVDGRYTSCQVDAFCDALRLFGLGYSWGGPMSLAVPYDLAAGRGGRWPAHLKPGTLVRLAIGLEPVGELQADLQQALAVALPV